MPRNEAKDGKASREKCWLPPFPSPSLYVEDPFDSVHIQRPPPAFLFPPPPADIYNLAAVLHIFPRAAANVFPREIHWQGNCTKAAAEKGQPAALALY